MAIDRSPLQPSIDCVKHIYSTANGAGSYQSLHSVLYLSNQIPCLITETSGPLLLLMTFIDKSNSWANLGRCGLILQTCEYVCVDPNVCVSVMCQSASRFMRIVTLFPSSGHTNEETATPDVQRVPYNSSHRFRGEFRY